MMMIFPLYERYLTVEIDRTGATRRKLVSDDLKITEHEAELFWNVFRDGLCHTGSFYKVSGHSASRGWTLPKAGLRADYTDLPKFGKGDAGEDAIFINPWGFAKHVFKKYEADTSLKLYADAPLLPLRYETK